MMIITKSEFLIYYILIAFLPVAFNEENENVEFLNNDTLSIDKRVSNNLVTMQDDSEIQRNFVQVNVTSDNNDSKIVNGTNINNSTFQVNCIKSRTRVRKPVEIVNENRLAAILNIKLNITSRQTPGKCVVVLFYSPSCPFSCLAAPHFNALSRYYPDIKLVAIDAMTYTTYNSQYGIFGIPTLILFHNGREAARLNETSDYSLELFARFIKTSTNMGPSGELFMTFNDFKGPISSVPVNEMDYYLLLSWIVIALHLLYSFYCSSWGRWLVDATLSAWREAEAQHHHVD